MGVKSHLARAINLPCQICFRRYFAGVAEQEMNGGGGGGGPRKPQDYSTSVACGDATSSSRSAVRVVSPALLCTSYDGRYWHPEA